MKKLLLSISAVILVGFANAQCTDLFISEYVEGSGNNNAIEVYNPTPNTIDLSGYVLKRYSNGSGTSTETINLTGNLASGDVIVVGNGQTDSVWVTPQGYWSLPVDTCFYYFADIHDAPYPAVCYFNGDDAITLETTGGVIIDIFGLVGEDPGAAWTDDATAGYTDANGGTWWTKRQTLIRKASVQQGVTSNPVVFNPTLEWDSLPDDTWSGLGFHACDCISTDSIAHDCLASAIKEISKPIKVSFFPNPVITNNFTIKASIGITTVRVYNVLGQTIFKKENEIIITSMGVDIGNRTTGLYLVKITLEKGTVLTRKIIIK